VWWVFGYRIQILQQLYLLYTVYYYCTVRTVASKALYRSVASFASAP